MSFITFLAVNGLKQKDIAEYLGISEASVSAYVKGKSSPSKPNLQKLLRNPQWDVTPLSDIANKEIADTIAIEMLRKRVRELEQQNQEYWELIKKLTSNK